MNTSSTNNPPQIKIETRNLEHESQAFLKPPENTLIKSPRSCLKRRSSFRQAVQEKIQETISSPSDEISITMDPEKDSSLTYHKNKPRRVKTTQELIYMFLEHPSGWGGFSYHLAV